MKALKAFHAIVRGRVQGVFFRHFTCQHARRLSINGYVRNLPSGDEVEVFAEGEEEALNRLLEYLRKGPPGARVDQVEVRWTEYSGRFRDFGVRFS